MAIGVTIRHEAGVDAVLEPDLGGGQDKREAASRVERPLDSPAPHTEAAIDHLDEGVIGPRAEEPLDLGRIVGEIPCDHDAAILLDRYEPVAPRRAAA